MSGDVGQRLPSRMSRGAASERNWRKWTGAVGVCLLATGQLACKGSPSAPSPSAGRPTGLSVDAISHGDRTVRLGWVRPNTASTYIIELGSGPGATDVGTVDTGDNGDFEILTNVRAGTTFARVRAKSSAGLSDPSN